jgi:hypothetical protein
MVDLTLHIGRATDGVGRDADKTPDFRLDDHAGTPCNLCLTLWHSPLSRFYFEAPAIARGD